MIACVWLLFLYHAIIYVLWGQQHQFLESWSTSNKWASYATSYCTRWSIFYFKIISSPFLVIPLLTLFCLSWKLEGWKWKKIEKRWKLILIVVWLDWIRNKIFKNLVDPQNLLCLQKWDEYRVLDSLLPYSPSPATTSQ